MILLPDSLRYGERSEQFFDLSLSVFRAIDETNRERLDLAKYTRDWGNLLLGHVHDEVCHVIIMHKQRLISAVRRPRL